MKKAVLTLLLTSLIPVYGFQPPPQKGKKSKDVCAEPKISFDPAPEAAMRYGRPFADMAGDKSLSPKTKKRVLKTLGESYEMGDLNELIGSYRVSKNGKFVLFMEDNMKFGKTLFLLNTENNKVKFIAGTKWATPEEEKATGKDRISALTLPEFSDGHDWLGAALGNKSWNYNFAKGNKRVYIKVADKADLPAWYNNVPDGYRGAWKGDYKYILYDRKNHSLSVCPKE